MSSTLSPFNNNNDVHHSYIGIKIYTKEKSINTQICNFINVFFNPFHVY